MKLQKENLRTRAKIFQDLFFFSKTLFTRANGKDMNGTQKRAERKNAKNSLDEEPEVSKEFAFSFFNHI